MIHILDMSADRWRALCGTPTPFRVSPGLHQFDRYHVDCVVCLDLDDHARQAAIAATELVPHWVPVMRSEGTPSDQPGDAS